jgi:hypothetical protein
MVMKHSYRYLARHRRRQRSDVTEQRFLPHLEPLTTIYQLGGRCWCRRRERELPLPLTVRAPPSFCAEFDDVEGSATT